MAARLVGHFLQGSPEQCKTRSPADAMGGRPYCPQSYKYNHAVRVFERSTRPTRCLVRPDWLPIVLLAVNTLPRHAGCYKQCLPHCLSTHVWHELHSSYAVIWTQITTILDVGFHDTQCKRISIYSSFKWTHNPTIRTWFAARKSICTI